MRIIALEMGKYFQVEEVPAVVPRYNIAPTQEVVIVRAARREEKPGWGDSSSQVTEGSVSKLVATKSTAGQASSGTQREMVLARWGLIPSWAKDPAIGNKLINARAETVAEKPSFRTALKRRRCLIPTDGFYEWKSIGKKKQPYFIHQPDERPFGIAGLWETWESETGPLDSCTIITTTANEKMRELHDRMPVIISPGDYDLWLDPAVQSPDDIGHLLAPSPAEEIEFRPVSTYVNNARHEGAQCLDDEPSLF